MEIIFVRTDDNKADGFTKNVKGEVFEKHSKDFVWDKEECGNASLAYQTMEELSEEIKLVSRIKHWTSVGRVLEVSVESSSTDARASIHTDKEARIREVKELTLTVVIPGKTGLIQYAGIVSGNQDQDYDPVTLPQPVDSTTN